MNVQKTLPIYLFLEVGMVLSMTNSQNLLWTQNFQLHTPLEFGVFVSQPSTT
jgi:hypothetical protein